MSCELMFACLGGLAGIVLAALSLIGLFALLSGGVSCLRDLSPGRVVLVAAACCLGIALGSLAYLGGGHLYNYIEHIQHNERERI